MHSPPLWNWRGSQEQPQAPSSRLRCGLREYLGLARSIDQKSAVKTTDKKKVSIFSYSELLELANHGVLRLQYSCHSIKILRLVIQAARPRLAFLVLPHRCSSARLRGYETSGCPA